MPIYKSNCSNIISFPLATEFRIRREIQYILINLFCTYDSFIIELRTVKLVEIEIYLVYKPMIAHFQRLLGLITP